MSVHTVKTASGRQYDIDLEAGLFRTIGDQPLGAFGRDVDDPHHDWSTFRSLDVDDAARLYIVEPDGSWRLSTRITEGLDGLVTALDGGSK